MGGKFNNRVHGRGTDRSGWEGNRTIGLMGGEIDRSGSWEGKLTDRVDGRGN